MLSKVLLGKMDVYGWEDENGIVPVNLLDVHETVLYINGYRIMLLHPLTESSQIEDLLKNLNEPNG